MKMNGKTQEGQRREKEEDAEWVSIVKRVEHGEQIRES